MNFANREIKKMRTASGGRVRSPLKGIKGLISSPGKRRSGPPTYADKTESVNYDPVKEKVLNQLKERVQMLKSKGGEENATPRSDASMSRKENEEHLKRKIGDFEIKPITDE